MRALIGLVGLGLILGASVEAGARILDCRWQVVLDRPGAQLTAVAAVADDDVWAVGADGSRGLILHWDGRIWRGTRSAILPLDVAAVSERDVWAVGASSPEALVSRARSEHWDGVDWRAVQVPAPPGTYLRGIAVLSTRAAWAVGAGIAGPLVVRWSGRAWRPVPVGPRDGLLHAIDPPWAVGTQGMMSATGSGSEDPLVERLQGGRWQVLDTPHLDSVDENLLAVDADSAGDVWAAGSADVLGGRTPLIQRLQGRVWRDESTIGLPTAKVALTAVAAFAPNDVWVAGYVGFGPEQTLLAHWNGTRWTQVQGRRGSLSDLSALGSRDIWAVGTNGGGSLVERYFCR